MVLPLLMLLALKRSRVDSCSRSSCHGISASNLSVKTDGLQQNQNYLPLNYLQITTVQHNWLNQF